MTDNEIKKAWECCENWESTKDCDDCPVKVGCSQKLAKYSLDLIKRKDAEIERLNIELQSMRSAANSYKMHYETAKSEAYKECLAKVKNYIKTHCNPYGKPDFDFDTSIKILNFIDDIVEEMTEVEE